MSSVHQRRIEQEWRLLEALVKTNPNVLETAERRIDSGDEVFSCELNETAALIKDTSGFRLETKHQVIVHFSRFFPSVPIEVSLVCPVFHPNVHPENGFVCLWGRFSPGDTVVEAMIQLQRVISWELLNQEPDHLMQPRALEWYKSPDKTQKLALAYYPLRKPAGLEMARTYGQRPAGLVRKRLS